jgi:diguanylate cyclase (GGDEF)-like protein
MNEQNVEWIYQLKKKILFGILGLLVVSTSAALIFIVITLRSSLLHDSRHKTQELGDVVESSLKSMMLKRAPYMMQETFDNMKKKNNSLVKAFIVDKNGRIAFSTDRNEIGEILDRFGEASCKSCHQLTGTAPKEITILIRTASGERAQRNVKVIYNEESCHACHSKTDRINGKLIVDRLLKDTYSLIIKTELLVFASGIGGIIILVPFLSRKLNKYILEIVNKNSQLILLLSVAERLSRSIEIRELRVLVADIVKDWFEADMVDIVFPRGNNDYRAYRWSRGGEGIARKKVEKDETLHLMISEWLGNKLDKERISDDGKQAYLPVKKGDACLALIAFGRLDKPFNPQRLELLNVVSDFMSMAFENARLYSIAITDELTLLFTTRHFRHCIDRELSEFEKHGQKFALLMLDIDNFKRVNDTSGHLAGDAVLKEVAQCMLHSIRDNDLVFRYGGEEFVVILPATDAKGGVLVAERIKKTVEDFIFDKGTNNLKITVSIGVSACPVNANTARALMASADLALYKAKETGKNRVVASQDRPPSL